MSELARLARVRNWSKYRLMGMTFPREGLTPEELDELKQAKDLITKVLTNWDERSMQLNLVPKKESFMTQVQLERKPYAKHIFYKGMYTHNSIGYSFDLTVEESVNSVQSNIIVEFEVDYELLPFDYDKACKEILAIYLPKENENKN